MNKNFLYMVLAKAWLTKYLKKYQQKAKFFKDDSDKMKSITNRMNLVNCIEQIQQQFILN